MKFKINDRVIIVGSDSWHEAAKKDIGKVGIITEIFNYGSPYYMVLVENSQCDTINRRPENDDRGYTWEIAEYALKPAIQIGEQLEFSFMTED